MYCRNCGKEVKEGTAFCPECGASVGTGQQPPAQSYSPTYNQNSNDTGSPGWAVLGFFFPLIGLILWLAWQRDRPASGRMAGLGALAGVILSIVLTILLLALFLSTGTTTVESVLTAL